MPAKQTAQIPDQFPIRKAVRYLEDQHGIDIGELSLRNKVRTLDIFTKDEGTSKGGGDGDRAEWMISRAALDAYAQAHKQGSIRTANADGAKAYKVSVNAAQLVELRAWAAKNGIAEPVRANKQYKGKTAKGGSEDAPSVEELAGEGEELFEG